MKYTLLIIYLLISVCIAQDSSELLISGEFKDTPFKEVVKELESEYPIHFYFAEAWVAPVYISYSAQQQPLTSFLDSMLDGTKLFYIITPGQKIILTPNYKIEEKLQISESASVSTSTENNLKWFQAAGGNQKESLLDVEEGLRIQIGSGPMGKNEKVVLSGYVRDERSGEPLTGASVYATQAASGAITDAFGYFTLELELGEEDIKVKYVGMQEEERKLFLLGDGQLDIDLVTEIVSLKEVVISGERSKVETVQTGLTQLTVKTIESIPTVLGDADLLKIALTIPGVQTVGEGAAGFNVRGGNTDQNLISLNDGIIYNPNHLFGFFSAFNPSVIRGADLYKSGMKAQYGGRISSVLDVEIRDGNKKKFAANGGINPLTAKITLEGPIQQDKSAFILGIRSTYSDWLLDLLDDPALSNSSASFSDVIGKVTHQIDQDNTINIAGYYSRDRFQLDADTVYQYANALFSAQWRHVFTNKLSALFSLSHTDYAYDIQSQSVPTRAFKLTYKIHQTKLKTDVSWFPSADHKLRFGAEINRYRLQPGQIQPLENSSFIQDLELDQEKGLEAALFIGDEIRISPRFNVYAGIRLSAFGLMGAAKVFQYAEGLPKEIDFITDTLVFKPGQRIQHYIGLEPRLTILYKLNDALSIKASYDKTRQYIHMLSNTTAIAPTDTWRLSNTYLKPQIGDQFTIGLYKTFAGNTLELSVEAYYKMIQNQLEYKDGANLIVNEAIETDVINGRGKAYGIEFLLRKTSGKLSGWLSYAWARAFVKANGVFENEKINDGQFFPSNFDQPHNLSLITNYKLNRRWDFSLNFTYSTGRPTTLPITTYSFNGSVYPFFTARNQYRIPDYLRLDIALHLEGNHRIDKLIHNSWSFSIYNLTGRNNAFSVFTRINDNRPQVYQYTIFSRAIPTITYNFKFL